MKVFDDLVNIKYDGSFEYNDWVECKHIATGFTHCLTCLSLNNCWFNFIKKPQIPLHEKCHCVYKTISKPIVNVNSNAKCDIKKFTDYIFADKYAWNGKRKLFELLGFSIKDSRYLKEEYEK